MTTAELNQYLEMLAKLIEQTSKEADAKEAEGLRKAAVIVRDNKVKV